MTLDMTFCKAGTGIVQMEVGTLLIQPDSSVLVINENSTRRYWP